MKRLFNYMAAALVAVSTLAVGCTADYIEPDQTLAPNAENFDVTIVEDQATNYVTFTLNNKGMVPMWIFGEEAVDGKPNKTYAYTGNSISLRFREAKTYYVEVKAYNAHGVSVGSKVCEFTLENTYRDPFDASPYMKALANTWQWDKETDGHFGCGSIDAETGKATTDGTDWWKCGPNGKDGVGLYDDTLTFTEAGEYTYNPGDDGAVYVNWGMAAGGNYPGNYADDEQDYQAPIESFTCAYSIENNWNEAGIEEIYLVLEPGHNLSYIPHQTAIDNPRYRFLETNVGNIRKTLSLVNEEPTENGGGGIAWKYQFVPFVHVAGPEELLAGTDAAGKVWVMDADTQGHLGCGDSVANPAGWWSAPPQDKAAYGLYDDEITFTPDGKYIYNSGPDGLMYINWGVTKIGPNPGAEPDIDIEWPLTESTYTFDGSTITLAANTPMVYVPSDYVWDNPVFHVTEISETKLVVVAENPGCYWQMIFKARDVKAPAVAFDGQDVAEGAGAELSLSQGQEIAVTGVNFADAWIDPDFFEIVNDTTLKFLAVDGDYRVKWDGKWFKVVPMYNGEKATYDNGKALWIIGDGGGKPTVDNLIGWSEGEAPLPCAKIGENTYRITLAMKAEGGSVKVFGQSDWGVEWKKENYGTVTDNGLFHIPGDDGNIHTIEGTEPGYYTFFFTDNDGILDMEVKKAKFGDQTIYDPAYEGNMWLNCNILEMTYYYAPGWAPIDNPGFEENGTNDYTITLPVATTDQWQAQVAFKTDMTTSADKNYDFYVVLNSTLDHPGVTIKLVLDGDDNTFYFADRHALTAYEDYVYKVPNMPGIDMSKINLFFDFGGCAENTVVNIKDILLQEHREAE
ncbi:MAG: DUF5121 domain-containing protein [Rikenellaceae bacterium]|nr:DUF5121 domain-containing protein [Rikenellaceae bacterium]